MESVSISSLQYLRELVANLEPRPSPFKRSVIAHLNAECNCVWTNSAIKGEALGLTLSTPWVSPKQSGKLCTKYILLPCIKTPIYISSYGLMEATDTFMCPGLLRVHIM